MGSTEKKNGTGRNSKGRKQSIAKGKTGRKGSRDLSSRRGSQVHTPGGRRKSRARRNGVGGEAWDQDDEDMDDGDQGQEDELLTEQLMAEMEQMENARELLNSAHSYYSCVSEGGTRHIRRRRKHEDGTYSDSESCGDDDSVMKHYEDIKNAKETLGVKPRKYGKKKKRDSVDERSGRRESQIPTPLQQRLEVKDEDELRSFSVQSVVSEGGTRRKVRRKVIRDEEGNIIGYGTPEPYMAPGESDGESVRLRRGSISDDEESRREGKRALRRLQKMVERPKRRQGQGEGEGEEDSNKPWVEEVLDGLFQKKKKKNRDNTDAADKTQIDIPDMPTAGGKKTQRRPTLASIEENDYFSDSSDDDVDLSAMTEEERKKYLEDKEKRRQDRERRMREKFGDKYDEMKRKRREQKQAEAKAIADAAAEEDAKLAASAAADDKGRRTSGSRRDSILQKAKQKPKSMVSYENAPGRNISDTIEKSDARNIGLSHSDWRRKSIKPNMPKKTREDGMGFDYKPKALQSLNLAVGGDHGEKSKDEDKGKRRIAFADSPDEDEDKKDEKNKGGEDLGMFEIGEDGQLKVQDGQAIDVNRIPSAVLRKLGINPKLSKAEIIRLLKKKLGNDVIIKDGIFEFGTKPITAYDLTQVTDDMLAEDPELDINTLKGSRRVNVLMRKGGQALKDHVELVISGCRLNENKNYATNLDEKDGSIDFMSHYRLVDPRKIEEYARAFAVEDRDLDTVLTFEEIQTALDGVNSITNMTSKQVHYVLKVLNIDDASQVTFRMFAVVTALCERVTMMDKLSKHLLEICNLADIERKLDLYKAMFYHNVRSDRQSNFITSESLKIELIAGGLNWKQQQYIMDKMEANSWGEISFLDYMCYIPLFMSMHDNICDNPLDMSDQKYVMPPRMRPPSAQRDMNPLGQPLSKISSFMLKKQARDLKEGRLEPNVVKEEQLKILKNYASLPDINTFDKPKIEEEDDDRIDLIY